MSNLADYFERNAYKQRYQIGDRVFGRWNKIPFVGSVGNDSSIERVTIHLDLPIRFAGKIHNIIIATHKDIKQTLKEI
jgi:hypothetical protein